MPKSRVGLTKPNSLFVEAIHDEFVAKYWAFDQPIRPGEHRDNRLIESAVNRPFQSALGKAIHRTILDKAAALFHSLVTNHAFENGNKRTAVLVTDSFLLANGYFLLLSNMEIYELAIETAQHNQNRIPAELMLKKISKKFRSASIRTEKITGSPELNKARILLEKDAMRLRRSIGLLEMASALERNWKQR